MQGRSLIAVCLAVASLNAAAAGSASASREILYYYNGQDQIPYGERVTVSVTPDSADVGMPGSIFIGVLRDGAEAAYFSNGSWIPFAGSAAPTEFFTAIPGGVRSYIVFDQTFVCQTVGYGSRVSLFAGYGVLTPQSEALVRDYHSKANPGVPADHIRNTYIRSNMSQNGKLWNVLDIDCRGAN